ncbi:MAG: HYR domain-containing protein [Saprospiraceae bacterium]|nr:HYR domain-containing protein [Saprospiraceae bacterium]
MRMNHSLRSLFSGLLIYLTPAFFCAQATQVKDIHPGGSSSNSNPASLVCFEDLLYFEATDGSLGRELYQSDGSNAGTILLKDIRPGAGSSIPSFFAVYGSKLYFQANDGSNGAELWETDGTLAGTVMFKDIKPGGGSSDPSFMTVVNGLLLFSADENATGRELYKSDGTPGGTVLVKDINPGASNSAPDEFVRVGNKLFFEATDGTNGRELWVSDGTAAGTFMVKNISAGGSSSNLTEMTAVGDILFFVVNDGINGLEVWKSDGTDAGTTLLKNIHPGGSSNPEELTASGGMLFFAADDNVNGKELWKSDGTEAGTVMVKDIRAGAANSNPQYLVDLNGVVMFTAHDGVVGFELWKSDGTNGGTVLVKDIRAGGAGSTSQIKDTYKAGPKIYFEANETSFGQEPWKSDGTGAGTVNIANINPPPGGNGSDPDFFTLCGPYIYFAARDGVTGTELWKTMADGDVTPPEINTCPVMITDNSSCMQVGTLDPPYSTVQASSDYATFSNATNQGDADDNVGITTVSYQDASTGTCPIVITRTWIVGDAAGNTASCVQTINMDDINEPMITSDAELDPCYATTAEAISAAVAATTAIDDCTAEVDLTKQSDIQGTCDALITVYVFDACGNSASASYSTSIDNTDPTIDCPSTQTQFLDSNCETLLQDYTGLADIDDNCQALVTVSQTPAPNTLYDAETTVNVVLVATDGCGNTAECNFDVIINDNTAPLPDCESDQTIVLNSVCQLMVPDLTDDATASDNCSSLFSWSQFPYAGTLMASGEGTTHTITVTVDDGNGNTNTCSVVLTGDDTTPPIPDCENDQTVLLNVNCEANVPNLRNGATATDNCSTTFTWTQSPAQNTKLSLAEGAMYTATVTANDGNGNTASCTVVLTADDRQDPVPTCEPDQIVGLYTTCDLTVPDLTDMATATDNCAMNFSWSQNPIAGSQLASGEGMTHTVTVTVDDGNGNTNPCTVVLTGDDLDGPTLYCPGNQTISLDNTCSFIMPDFISASSAYDNCSNSFTWAQSPPATTLILSGEAMMHFVTVTADDGNGNSDFCVIKITADDIIPPDPVCENNQTRNLNVNCKLVVPDLTDGASATDNCSANFSWSQNPAFDARLNSGEGMTHTVTVTVDDGNGNTNTCTVVLTGDDKRDPEPICEPDQIIMLDQFCQLTVPDLTDGATASDNCSSSFTWGQSLPPGTMIASGEGMTHTITVTVDDGNGNSTTCSVILTGDDTTPPDPICVNGGVISLDAECEILVPDAVTGAYAYDNCSQSFSWSQSPLAGTELASGEGMSHTITVTADDGNGNTNTCSVVISGDDVTPPVPDCENNQTVALNANCELMVPNKLNNATATDNCSMNFTWAQNPTIGSKLASGEGMTHTVTVTVDDGNGNSASCTVILTGDDRRDPLPICVNDQTIILDEDCELLVPDLLDGAIASDNCSTSFSWTQDPAEDSELASGEGMTHTVTVTADDGNGNTGTCVVILTGDDQEDPLPDCEENQVITLNENCELVVPDLTDDASATDNCASMFSWSQSIAVNTALASGEGVTHTVTVTVDDGNGNSNTCEIILTGDDRTNPEPDCEPLYNVSLDENCELYVLDATYDASATDNCATSFSWSQSISPGTLLASGEGMMHTLTLTVDDGNGNSATCLTVLIGDDKLPPFINCESSQTIELDEDCQLLVPDLTDEASATDNCSMSFTWEQSTMAGALIPSGEGMEHYFTVTVHDGNGNSSICFLTLTGNDAEIPTLVCEDPQIVSLNHKCELLVPDLTDGALVEDNCATDFIWTQSPAAGTFLYSGNGMTHTITVTVDDGNGNSTSCTTVLTGDDNTPPSIECPIKTTRGTTEGLCKYVIQEDEFDAAASDNCSLVSLEYELSGVTIGSGMNTVSGSMLNKGTTTIKWKASDAAGNMSMCSFTVEVKDTEPPSITCPPNINVITAPGQCSVPSGSVPLGTPVVSDNCAIKYPLTNNSPGTYPLGVTNVKWIVTDSSGNTKSCIQKVTVTPYNCGKPTSVSHFDVTYNSAKVSWAAGLCATGYELRIRKQLSPGVWGPYSSWAVASGPGNLHMFMDLDESTYYHYQVRAKCGNANSTSVNGFFTTLASGFLKKSIKDEIQKNKEYEQLLVFSNLSEKYIPSIDIHPNPGRDFVIITLNNWDPGIHKLISIVDIFGRVVYNVIIEQEVTELELDLQQLELSTGLYLVKISGVAQSCRATMYIER